MIQGSVTDAHSEVAVRGGLRRWAVLAGLAAVLLIYPFVFTQPFPQHLMVLLFMYANVASGWNILGGYAGQVSLGHAIYFGIAAYGSVLLQIKLGMPAWPAFILGGGVAVLLSLAIGIPTFRLAGHYFSIATIAVGEILRILFLNWEWAGAAVGLYLPIKPNGLWNFQFTRPKLGYYYVALAMLVLTLIFVAWLQRSRWGYYFRAIKGNPEAASAMGINLARYKVLANAFSAFVTGLGGAFYAQYVLYIDPSSVMPSMLSVLVMLLPVMGGVGTLWGPVVGAAVLIPISELTRVYWGGSGSSLDLLIYGILIILFMLFQPSGLIGLWKRVRRGGSA